MLLLIGFPEDEVEKLEKKYDDIIPVSAQMENKMLEEIIKERKIEENYQVLGEQRMVIMHDVPRENLSKIMRDIREEIGQHIIFATSTPTSLKWKISDLMKELIEEDMYFRGQKTK